MPRGARKQVSGTGKSLLALCYGGNKGWRRVAVSGGSWGHMDWYLARVGHETE
ncbi:unnamed protein product [Sphenostylis stenocarpa]|uniref:Uncharacterized protein n=1 Tax=Sphenostylis stenocarpa TaxID=92480 RepID=A0AA86RZ72_9FABA|nr:unnamed protein product [Sphenostylis stenocarpa]